MVLHSPFIYLAAPLFSQAELLFNAQLASYLQQQGYSIFLPQAHCGEQKGQVVYHTCLMGLTQAAVVIAILDGADADSGTCWECGYAVAKNIPVIVIRTDVRQSGDTKGFNAMLYFSATAIIEGANYLSELLLTLQQLKRNGLLN